jgi:hypothetical protein
MELLTLAISRHGVLQIVLVDLLSKLNYLYLHCFNNYEYFLTTYVKTLIFKNEMKSLVTLYLQFLKVNTPFRKHLHHHDH